MFDEWFVDIEKSDRESFDSMRYENVFLIGI